MATRKELIILKYLELTDFCRKNLNTQPFPDILEVDITDLLYVITLNFSKDYQNYDKYIETIEMLADFRGVEVDKDLLYKHKDEIGSYLDWFINFIKTQK